MTIPVGLCSVCAAPLGRDSLYLDGGRRVVCSVRCAAGPRDFVAPSASPVPTGPATDAVGELCKLIEESGVTVVFDPLNDAESEAIMTEALGYRDVAHAVDVTLRTDTESPDALRQTILDARKALSPLLSFSVPMASVSSTENQTDG